MGRNKILLILVVISIFLWNCSSETENEYLERVSNLLKEQKESFNKVYKKKNLLDHFPKNLKNTADLNFLFAPPSCPPSFECIRQSGDIYLSCKLDSAIESDILNISLQKYNYTVDEDFIIDIVQLVKQDFPLPKTNKYILNKHPIPLFEQYDFGLGSDTIELNVNGKIKYRSVNLLPSDLYVYVIESEPGNFWVEPCNEKRPASLKEWQNGYSRGIAISKKQGIAVYWAIVW